jgi:Xaa-Pro aminopeptidase
LTEFEQRRQNVAAALGPAKLDALLVSSPASIRYLCDYTGSNGLLLVTKAGEHFFTDPRYELDATQRISCKVHIAKRPLMDEAAAVIKKSKLKRVGFEPNWLHFGDHQKLKDAAGPGTALQPHAGMVEGLRMVKSPAEIAKIRRSVVLNSEAFTRTIRRIRPGLREQEVAAELDFQMRTLGAEKTAFETIVAAGPRTALPHAHPTIHKIADRELVLIDMGATLDGYTSDMTRMLHIGSAPREIRAMYKAVLEAQLVAIHTVREGVPAAKVDMAARSVLKRNKLRAGMVITIEPGVYINGVGGIRIEDTVLVTENGCQVLTPTSKEFVQL